MKSIRTYLIVVATFLTFALIAGVVVWYLYQNLDGAQPNVLAPVEENTYIPMRETSATPKPPDTEPIVLDADSLTPTQQKMLSAFGHDEEEIVITKSQILCAEDAVGKARLSEIVDGSAPSPLEAMKLLPCFKK